MVYVAFWHDQKRQTKSGCDGVRVVAIVTASSNRFKESPPKLQILIGAVTLTGFAVPALEGTGLPFGSPANVTIMGGRDAFMGVRKIGVNPTQRLEHITPLWAAWCERNPTGRHRKPCGMAHHAIEWRV